MKKLISLLLVFAMLVCYIPVNASAADERYVVAGVEGLCGTAWNPGDLSNAMVCVEDNLYELTYYSVPAGTYEFKVTNGTWDQCWGDDGNNYVIEVNVLSDVTIVFDAEMKDISVAIIELEF